MSKEDFIIHQDDLSSLLFKNLENEETFNQLLFNGADINAKNKNAWCLLFEVIMLKLNHKIKYIIDSGAFLNTRDNKGRNALFWAVYFENVEAFKVLLDLGIDLCVNSKENLHVIQYTIYKGNLELLKVLITAKLPNNNIDDIKATALIFTVLYNKADLLDFLLKNAANKDYMDSFGNTALSLAKELKINNMIEKLKG